VSYQQYAVPSPRLGRLGEEVPPERVWDSYVYCQGERLGQSAGAPMPAIPEGKTVQDVIAEGIVAHQATKGADISGYDTNRITSLSQYNLFPNTTVLCAPDLVSVLTSRPGLTPDDAQFVMMTFEPAPAAAGGGVAPRSEPMTVEVPLGTDLGVVMSQDIGIMTTAQRGLHQPGLTHLALSAEECRVINLHRNLDEWIISDGG